MTQLKNTAIKLKKVSEAQDYQQSQIMLENDKCTKVSKNVSHLRNELPGHSENMNNKSIYDVPSSTKKIDLANFPHSSLHGSLKLLINN